MQLVELFFVAAVGCWNSSKQTLHPGFLTVSSGGWRQSGKKRMDGRTGLPKPAHERAPIIERRTRTSPIT
jgi:hypothetical protein